jgi:hypothetical protein
VLLLFPNRIPGDGFRIAPRLIGIDTTNETALRSFWEPCWLAELGRQNFDKNLTDCAQKRLSPTADGRTIRAIFRIKPTRPDITDAAFDFSGPRYRGSNPCLPATKFTLCFQ